MGSVRWNSWTLKRGSKDLPRRCSLDHVHQTLGPRGEAADRENQSSNLFWKEAVLVVSLLKTELLKWKLLCFSCCWKTFWTRLSFLTASTSVASSLVAAESTLCVVNHKKWSEKNRTAPRSPPRPFSSAASWGLSWWWQPRLRWSRLPNPVRRPGGERCKNVRLSMAKEFFWEISSEHWNRMAVLDNSTGGTRGRRAQKFKKTSPSTSHISLSSPSSYTSLYIKYMYPF